MTLGCNYLFVIGIDKYDSSLIADLNNAVSDAKSVMEALIERYGFELFQEPIFDSQATKANIYAGFTRLVGELQAEDNLIIYYSGHGRMNTMTSKGYWVPSEANDTPVELVENSAIKDFIESMKAKHIFLISDSCFSGTFLTTTRGSNKEWKYIDLHKNNSRWMLASGGEETVNDGVKGKNSPFARNLLDCLNLNTNKHISVEEIIRYVSVLTAAETKQKPIGAHIDNIGHAGGQMILTLKDAFVSTSFDTTRKKPQSKELLIKFRSVYVPKFTFSVSRDIIVIESFVKGVDLLIIGLFRFDETGAKYITFRDGYATFKDNEGKEIKWKVVQRFATTERLEKFIEENKLLFYQKRVIVMGVISEIDRVEISEIFIQHQEFLQDVYDVNEKPMECLHCSNMINTNDSYFVEIDEEGLNVNVGNVHCSCLRSLDRIIGRTSFQDIKETNLINFDFDRWISLSKKGQGFLRNAKSSLKESDTAIISWNRKHNFNIGDYCIKMVLEDGSFSYLYLGKEIHRFHSNEIDTELSFFKKKIDENKNKEDAFAYTSKGLIFGTVSQLKKLKKEDEAILLIIDCEKIKYSNQINVTNKGIDNDYTPLGIVINPENGEIINFGNYIPFISDPSRFDDFHNNWNAVGYTVGKCSLRIIESDKDFDLYLIDFFKDGMQPIIDPLFDKEKVLTNCLYVRDIDEIREQAERKSFSLLNDAKWKAGDRVKVVFPEAHADKFPEGTIITDEFVNEHGERCVIFCPIVGGIQRQDLEVSIPSKFLQKL